jgi:hypothetical protein
MVVGADSERRHRLNCAGMVMHRVGQLGCDGAGPVIRATSVNRDGHWVIRRLARFATPFAPSSDNGVIVDFAGIGFGRMHRSVS